MDTCCPFGDQLDKSSPFKLYCHAQPLRNARSSISVYYLYKIDTAVDSLSYICHLNVHNGHVLMVNDSMPCDGSSIDLGRFGIASPLMCHVLAFQGNTTYFCI